MRLIGHKFFLVMKTNEVAVNEVVLVESLHEDVLGKKTSGTSNGKVKFVCGKFDLSNFTSYANEKDGRNLIDGIRDGKGLSPSQSFAFQALKRAQDEFERQISYNVNKLFEADVIVTELIKEVAKTDGADFFTADFLRKYDLYRIPSGVILDTFQRCKSFVSSLYTAAYKAYLYEIKKGNSIDIAVKLCKERIKSHDNEWMSTKWDRLNALGKMRVIAPVIFWNWYELIGKTIPENSVRYTHAEQVQILRKLGINIRLKGRKEKAVSDIIEIEEYKPARFGTSHNFFHEYATSAKKLCEEDKRNVMSLPVTPLATKRKTTK